MSVNRMESGWYMSDVFLTKGRATSFLEKKNTCNNNNHVHIQNSEGFVHILTKDRATSFIEKNIYNNENDNN